MNFGNNIKVERALTFNSQTGDISTPVDGQVWYNSTTNKFRKRENGVTSDLDTGGSLSIGDTITSATAGSILFAGASGVLAQDNTNLFWDDTNNRLGIGLTSPTAILHLKAGTATANTAPLKLTTGTALTTPEDGAIEYHTSHLYFTIGSTRYQIDQQGISDGDKGDITVSGSGATWTIDANAITTSKVTDANITKAKIENVAVGNVLGRSSTTAGAPEEVGVPIVLSSGSVSAVASLNIDLSNWYTVYDVITIELFAVRPVTDGAVARIRVSSDGTTYASGASTYKFAFKYVSGAGAEGVLGGTDTYIAGSGVGSGVDNASTSDYSGTIKIMNPNKSTVYPLIRVDANYFNSAGEYFWFSGGGSRQAAQVCRGIQLSFSTGNISAASYKIIGIKNN